MIILKPHDLHLVAMGFARLCFSQSDLGQFRVGIGRPRDVGRFCLGRNRKHQRTDHNTCVVPSHMRELKPPRDIADSIDLAVTRP